MTDDEGNEASGAELKASIDQAVVSIHRYLLWFMFRVHTRVYLGDGLSQDRRRSKSYSRGTQPH